jgi:two-component system sensor histidine kinase KdpD
MSGPTGDIRAEIDHGVTEPTRRRSTVGPRRRQLIGALGAAIALILLTVAMAALDDVVSLPSILLLFLIVVVGASAVGGFWPAIGTAVASFLLVNWFFTPPVHTLIIARGEHWIALVVFVVVGVFVAGVVEVAVRRAAEAAQSRDEAQKLARLAGMAPVASLLDGLVQEFHLEGASVIGRDANGGWNVRGSSGAPVSASDTTGSLAVDADHTLLITGGAFPSDSSRLVAAFVHEISTALTIESLRRADEQARQLQRATELLTSLLAAVSHDVRTPLASIRAAVTSLLATDVHWDAAQTADFLETIDEEAEHLDRLLGNLLDMSRLRTGALTMTRKQVTWDEVVSAAVAYHERSAQIRVAVDESLPAVLADPGLLERSVANVIANALEVAPDGTYVSIVGRVHGEQVAVDVIDHGPGIASTDRVRAVAPFQRLGDHHASGSHVGLGLAVAKGFIEAMGGSIELSDTPGGGLTVTLTLERASTAADHTTENVSTAYGAR